MKKFRWDTKYLYWGITAFLVIVCGLAFFLLLNRWSGFMDIIRKIFSALSSVVYGLVFAYLLNKLMTLYERAFLYKLGRRVFPKNEKKARRFMRALSVLLTIATAVVIVGGLLALVLPQIVASIQLLAGRMQGYLEIVSRWITTYLADNPSLEHLLVNTIGNLAEWFTNWLNTNVLTRADQILANITSGAVSVVMEIANMLVGLVISVYLLYHRELFVAQAKKVIYGVGGIRRGNKALGHLRSVDKMFGGFISAKLLDSLIVGVVCYIILVILRMPYAMLVSVLVGVTNVIPFFGPFIGAIPSGLLILLEDPAKCVIFIIVVVVLQQLDGNILYPRLQANAMGLSGFWVMFAILFFGGMFGFWGMMLGVPIFAVLYSIMQGLTRGRLKKRTLPEDTETYENLTGFDAETKEPIYREPAYYAPGGWGRAGKRRRREEMQDEEEQDR